MVKAELFRTFATLKGSSKMAPYAVMQWQEADGVGREAAHTRTDPRPGLSFQWHHTCRAQPYPGEQQGHQVSFTVFHERLNGFLSATLCGQASIALDELLSGCKLPSGEISVTRARTVELTLKKGTEDTGVLTIQAMLVRQLPALNRQLAAEMPLTKVDPAIFEDNVCRLGVSGGTAPFFRLVLRPEAAKDRSEDYYIGKDLSHATDEVNFYEEALEASRRPSGGGLEGLNRFMFEYAGVCRCEVQGCGHLDLLVMRNLRDRCEKLRMVDIKIGQKTADAGWQGKSRVAALRQSIIDGATNSCEEGFRLEGFDGAPPTLSSMDPLLDLAIRGEGTKFQAKLRKKALRIMYQRMPAAEMLMHLVDVHQVPADPGPEKIADTMSPIELGEIVLHEVVVRLTQLALACRMVMVPQKWIGSSVALGFDCGRLPSRKQPVREIREAVKVNIFDWGRSEYNTLSKHNALSDDEQNDRAQFWGFYKGGIDRLLYESTRSYWHRFGNWEAWSEAQITIYDFDSMTDNDMIGRVSFEVAKTPEVTATLTDVHGNKITGPGGNVSTLTYRVEYQQLPDDSRLSGSWRIHIVRAANLKACDRMQGRFSSDPFAVLLCTSKDKHQHFRQQTSVMVNNLNPEWDETLQVPVARSSNQLEEALTEAASALGIDGSRTICAERIGPLLPPEDASSIDVEHAISGFRSRLDWAASSCSSPSASKIDERRSDSIEVYI